MKFQLGDLVSISTNCFTVHRSYAKGDLGIIVSHRIAVPLDTGPGVYEVLFNTGSDTIPTSLLELVNVKPNHDAPASR